MEDLKKQYQILKIKVGDKPFKIDDKPIIIDDKPLNCKICKDYIEQNQLKNAFCYMCGECDDFAICYPGCKIQLD